LVAVRTFQPHIFSANQAFVLRRPSPPFSRQLPADRHLLALARHVRAEAGQVSRHGFVDSGAALHGRNLI